MSAEQLVHQSAVSRRLLPFAGNAAAIRQCCRDPAAARLETNGLRLAQIGNKPPLSRQIVEREQRRARIVGGEGGIRTLGPPQGGQRFSRPPRSTAPAPLHPNGGEGLARGREEQQGNAVSNPATGSGRSVVFAVALPNLTADLARGEFRRMDVGIGGV